MRNTDTPLKGIGLKLFSVLVFMTLGTLIKIIAHRVPPGEVVFFRSAFAIPVILIWLVWARDLAGGLATRNYMGHFWRGLAGTTAMGFGFAGLGLLPLPEVTAIGYAAPLLTVVFAAMFLGEEVRLFRLVAVGIGLVGVLIIMSPNLTALRGGNAGATEALGAVVVLVGAVFTALAQVFVRRLVSTETTSAIVFFFSLNSALLALVTLPFGWVWPDPATAAILVMTGLLGGVGQVFLTSCYRYADASVVAPFEYASMILSIAIGYVGFGEVPGRATLLGAAIVILAGIIIIWREHQLGLERVRQRQAMTPQG
ncbi:MAG: DMT family transporter [Proteobacteria bacterium]|nr:DMT family transporter [Pseudomonadota bacterium]MBS0574146.1 DMT family transporter [Pseudomonadota bacterium]